MKGPCHKDRKQKRTWTGLQSDVFPMLAAATVPKACPGALRPVTSLMLLPVWRDNLLNKLGCLNPGRGFKQGPCCAASKQRHSRLHAHHGRATKSWSLSMHVRLRFDLVGSATFSPAFLAIESQAHLNAEPEKRHNARTSHENLRAYAC